MARFKPSTDEAIDAAREHGAQRAKLEPVGKSISYDRHARILRLGLPSGVVLEFPRELVPELAAATEQQLAECLALTPSGSTLRCEPIDMDIAVDGLVLDLVMPAGWQEMIRRLSASQIGRIKTPAKAAASQANGKKGGRPRKSATVAESTLQTVATEPGTSSSPR